MYYNKFFAFLFIKGAELLFVNNRKISGRAFLLLIAFFGRLEMAFFTTNILLALFTSIMVLYLIFFSVVFNNKEFAKYTCDFLKENSDASLFNSVIGNLPYHVFAAKIGGFSAKVLLKQTVSSFAVVGSGLLISDHAFHECGAKVLVDTKIHFVNEQIVLDFAKANELPYTPSPLPPRTQSIVRNFADFAIKKL